MVEYVLCLFVPTQETFAGFGVLKTVEPLRKENGVLILYFGVPNRFLALCTART